MFFKKKFQDGMVTFWGANVELKETKYVVVSYWNYKNNSKKLTCCGELQNPQKIIINWIQLLV